MVILSTIKAYLLFDWSVSTELVTNRMKSSTIHSAHISQKMKESLYHRDM